MRDFFNNLPSEITSNIFLGLPVDAIATSKCVCKPWLRLLQSNDFVNSHLAQSVPSLAVMLRASRNSSCIIVELEGDEIKSHTLHCNQLTRVDFRDFRWAWNPAYIDRISGCANGLLFLLKKSDVHCICNPITREYIEVRCPIIRPDPTIVYYPEITEENLYASNYVNYGFGASKISCQYKVVRILLDCVMVHESPSDIRRRVIPESECYVYTLGTGLWMRVEVEAGVRLDYSLCDMCVYLNGNLYWVVLDSNGKHWISCFDLETERFSHFSTPLIFDEYLIDPMPGFSVLGDCLCLCDSTCESEIVIWLMKEYGVEKSWTKEYVINIDPEINPEVAIDDNELIYPIKLFKDGDILMLQGDLLFYYSSKTGTTEEIDIFTKACRKNSFILVNPILLTPSFVSLKSFGADNAISF